MKKTLFGLGMLVTFSIIFMGCPSPSSAKTEELSLTEKLQRQKEALILKI